MVVKNDTPKYIQVKELIRNEIKKGNITDKLPGERTLAKQLNVSYMTVRKAVAELVEEGILHKLTTRGTFVSNRKISPKTTNNIGFLLDEGILDGISSPYYSLIFKALEKICKKHGYNLLLFSDHDDLNPINNQKKIDGVIICNFPRIESKVQEIKNYLPIVLLDNIASDKSIPSVTIDNFNGCYKATEHLIKAGHKRIGFVSGLLDSDVCKDRLLGYSSALANNNIKNNKSLIYRGDYSYESGENAAKHFLALKKHPTAIVCANDSMAIGLSKVLREQGLEIPKDISIIGFDDIEVASRIFPTLTTVAAPIQELAQQSFELLLASINGIDIDYRHIILPGNLILRNSTLTLKK